MKKERESFWSDFKKFVSRGNVLDLAVAVVVANAFNAIVRPFKHCARYGNPIIYKILDGGYVHFLFESVTKMILA